MNTWEETFQHWIIVTQEKIDWWQSNDPSVVVAKHYLKEEGIDFDKVFIEKWKCQIKAWRADLESHRLNGWIGK